MRKVTAIIMSALLASPSFALPQTTPAVKTSFQDVAAHLDPNGNFYLYMSTEEWLRGLSGQIDRWRDLFNAGPNTTPPEQANVARGFDALKNLIKNSGVDQISGFGMSSIAVERDLYRGKSILHHYKGNGAGYLWSIFGQNPHSLNGLDLLPASTALATFSDVDLPALWSILNKEIGQAGIPGASEFLQGLAMQLGAMSGSDPDKVFASLGREIGIILTLDETRMITMPGPGSGIRIPDAGIMLIINVTNDTILDLVDSAIRANPAIIYTERNGLRMRTLPGPTGPFTFRPSIARSGDYLILASTDSLIEAAVAAKSGARPGLKSTDEFNRVSRDLPDQGNSFTFVSQRFGDTLARVMSQTSSGFGPDAAASQFLTSLFGPAGAFRVSTNTDEGWITIGNGGQNPANMLMISSLAAPLILASVVIPAVLRPTPSGGSNESAAVANLRTIATAQITYLSISGGKYGDLRALIAAGLLDSRFNSTVSGYDFQITLTSRGFMATATPASPNRGRFGYYVTEDAVVRYSVDPTLAPQGQSGQPVQ